MHQIKRALISVSDKSGIIEFAKGLNELGIEILSTGGTYKLLVEQAIPAKKVEDYTGFPEMMDGRVKTLHPKIHGGILALKNDASHLKSMADHDIQSIDMVVVNLYPFESTIKKPDISLETAIENIDIGGPSMLRAAAKNYKFTLPVTDPNDYPTVLDQLRKGHGTLPDSFRFDLMVKVFQHTAHYDTLIANYFYKKSAPSIASPFIQISERLHSGLRYGENSHQNAAFYGNFVNNFEQLHGKELSYNNLIDLHGAVELIEEFEEPAVAIIKHTNPCGVATGSSILEAYKRALETDPVSAFGGIVAMNRPIDLDTAGEINKIFTEIVISPEFPDPVMEILSAKRDRRLIRQKQRLTGSYSQQIKSICGGILVQNPDHDKEDYQSYKVVTNQNPSPLTLNDLVFAWKVVKHVKSNAIVFVKNGQTLGIGAGQMSRVDSSKVAIQKARDSHLDLNGSVVASDAFFPFADSISEIANAGSIAIIQPGGSIRDDEVIASANQYGLSMLFTGIRHFKH